MSARALTSLVVVFVASSAVQVSAQGIGRQALPEAQAVQGTYNLSFLRNDGTPLGPGSTLPVGEELVLQAHVTDGAGFDAQRGSVTFQVCSRSPGRSLKLDPAPSSDCDITGTGSWVFVFNGKVDGGLCPGTGPGFVCVNFGAINTPRTVGFRFRYAGQGSGIANRISEAKDASWVTP